MSTAIVSRKQKSRKVIAQSWLPTNARPGSEEKIAVFASRFERGEQLFHPHDYRELVPLSMRGCGGPVEAGPKKGALQEAFLASPVTNDCDDLEIGDDE